MGKWIKMDTRNSHTRTQQNRQTNDTHKTYIVLQLPVIDMHLKKIKHDSDCILYELKKGINYFVLIYSIVMKTHIQIYKQNTLL